MLTRGIVRTGIPAWSIRFDDGSAEQMQDAMHYIRRGIPISFAINSDTIGNPGKHTWDDLRHLIGQAGRYGTEIEFLQHSKTNWSKYLVGDPAAYSNWNFDSYNWEDIVAEVDPTEIETELGVPVRGYIQPGDANPIAFCRHNRRLIESALRSVGIEWAFGLHPNVNGAGDEGLVAGMFRNSTSANMNPYGSFGNMMQLAGLRPGVIVDPYTIPGSNTTIDLGASVVPRGRENGSLQPVVDPNSGADGWLLGEDNNGSGVEGNQISDFEKTVHYKFARALSFNAWAQWGMHGEARSNAETLALSTGSAVTPRHWSAKHVAWMLFALRANGHIRLTTATDWATEVFSDFAEGVDLISNPEVATPIFDIGCAEVYDLCAPRGVTAKAHGLNSLVTAGNPIVGGLTYGANGYLETNTAGLRVLDDVIGPNALLLPRARMRGAINMRPAADPGSCYGWEFLFPMLPAGLYRLDLSTFVTVTGTVLAVSRFGIYATRQSFNSRAQIEAVVPDVASSVPEACVLRGADERQQLDVPHLRSSEWSLYFDCDPARCFPQIMLEFTADPGTVAAGSTAALPGQTMAGARIGGRAHALTAAALPSGVYLSAEVTDDDVLTVTVHNGTGSAWSPGSIDFFGYAEDLGADALAANERLVATPWVFAAALSLSCDGAAPLALADPRLVLVKRY